MMKKALCTFLILSLTAGCYSSTSLKGDGASDPGTDPLQDPAPDPQVDPWRDPDAPLDIPFDYPPEFPPDILPDMPPDIPPDYIWDIPPACVPAQGVRAHFTIDGTDWPSGFQDLQLQCRIDGMLEEEEGHSIIVLGCISPEGINESHLIEIFTYPPAWIYIWETEMIMFRYVVDSPFWSNRWFSLRYDWGQPIIIGVDADSLARYDMDRHEFYSPLRVDPVGNICPYERWECFDNERVALQFSARDVSIPVLDQTEGYLSFLDFYDEMKVESAVHRHDIRCTDTPPEWYKALIFSYPGD